MPRLMSVAMTADAVIERRKTVTRRKGWTFLKPGDRLTLCRKVQGRKPGEPLARLAEVEVVSVERHRLDDIFHPLDWGFAETEREGFPGMEPGEFVRRYFVDAQGMTAFDEVTRIEWRYLDTVTHYAEWGVWSAECDHGGHIWCVERGTRHLARRSLNAHLRDQHGIEPSP